MRDTLDHLRVAGFIVQADGDGGYFPARELDSIALAQVLLSLRSHGGACMITGEERAQELLETVDLSVATALGGLTLKDLATPEKIPPGVDKEGAVGI